MAQVPGCGCNTGGGGGEGDGCRCDYRLTPLSRERLEVEGVAVGLPSVPVGTDMALIENIIRQTQNVRWTDEGTPPVGGGASGFGHYLGRGTTIEYRGDFSAWQAIRDQGGTAVLEITYYSIA